PSKVGPRCPSNANLLRMLELGVLDGGPPPHRPTRKVRRALAACQANGFGSMLVRSHSGRQVSRAWSASTAAVSTSLAPVSARPAGLLSPEPVRAAGTRSGGRPATARPVETN